MWKKIVCLIILINIVYVSTAIYANDEEIDEEFSDISWIYEDIEEINSNAKNEPTINSRSAIIYDRTNGDIIWGKDENSKRKMASTTKIMTAIIVIENVQDLSSIVTISSKAAGIGGSRLKLSTGDKITVNDLLYGLMLRSGNDCAIALAEHVSENVDNFVDKMNEKVIYLGLTQTHFITVNGLDADEHYTTALELAKLTDYALKNDIFKNIVSCKSYTVTINGIGRMVSNTNELLGSLDGVYGVKTGFTNGANRCLVTATKRGDMDIICIVLGADTKKDRTRDSIKLIEYVFANYSMVNIEDRIKEAFDKWNNTNNIAVIKGKEEYAQIELDNYQTKTIIINNENINDINISINSLKIIEGTIKKGTKVGELKVKVNNETKLIINLIISKDILRKNQKDYFIEMLQNYISYFIQ